MGRRDRDNRAGAVSPHEDDNAPTNVVGVVGTNSDACATQNLPCGSAGPRGAALLEIVAGF